MEAKPLQAQQKMIDRLRAGHTAESAWANMLGPNFKTDNSASLLRGARIGRETNAVTAEINAERRVQAQADAEAALRPRPLTAEEQLLRDQQAEQSRRSTYAATGVKRGSASPTQLPEVPA
jgi:hypothetical protein